MFWRDFRGSDLLHSSLLSTNGFGRFVDNVVPTHRIRSTQPYLYTAMINRVLRWRYIFRGRFGPQNQGCGTNQACIGTQLQAHALRGLHLGAKCSSWLQGLALALQFLALVLRSVPRHGRSPRVGAVGGAKPLRLLASCLLDDLFRHVPRNLGVRVELHRVTRPPLRLAAQVADVAEHL